MIELRQRMYLVARAFQNLRLLEYQNLWRVWNALRCLASQGSASISSRPFFAQIEPTTACNLECRFCLNTALPHPRHILSYDQFVHILDSLPGLLFINLQGLGEPTMNKDLFRMASEARRRNIYVYTVTNLNLQEKMIQRLADSDFNAIEVSLESVDPERYEWYRRGGNFSHLESNLHLLSELKSRNGRNFSIGFWASVTSQTLGSLQDIFQFAATTGAVERIQVQVLQTKDNYVAIYDDDLKAQRFSDLEEAEIQLRRLLRIYSKQYGIRASLVGGRCKWPWGGVFINATGLLAPCCNIKDYRNPFWGDIANGSLDEAWHSQDWVSLREGLLTGQFHSSCQGCPSARINSRKQKPSRLGGNHEDIICRPRRWPQIRISQAAQLLRRGRSHLGGFGSR